MLSNATLIVMSLCMIILVSFWCRLRWSQLNVVDVYVLMAGVFFGAYGFVDGLVANQSIYKPIFIVWTFSWILILTATTWLISQRLPKQTLKILNLRSLISQWACVDYRFILFLLVAVLAFTIYCYSRFRIISHFVFESLWQANIFLPYWYTSARVFVQPILFCIFLSVTIKLLASRRKKRVFWCFILALTFFLTAIYGRRAVFLFVFIFLIINSLNKRKNLFALGSMKFLILLIPFLLIFSNIYQNYRPFIWSYNTVLPRTVDLPGIFEASVDTEATLSNLRRRMATWKFNYLIMEKQAEHGTIIPYGGILFQSFINSIPRVIWPQKKVYNLEEMAAVLNGLPITDYPTNNFGMAQADLGYLSIFFLPIQMFITLFIISTISIFVKQMPGLFLIITGFMLYYIVEIERGYAGVFILYRNLFILCAIYLIGHMSIKIFREK